MFTVTELKFVPTIDTIAAPVSGAFSLPSSPVHVTVVVPPPETGHAFPSGLAAPVSASLTIEIGTFDVHLMYSALFVVSASALMNVQLFTFWPVDAFTKLNALNVSVSVVDSPM